MSTLAMCAHIIFPANARRSQVELRKPRSVEIDRSVHDVCQTATLTLAHNVSQFEQQQLRTYLRRGDRVEIWLGYNGELNKEFDGFIERVGGDVPTVLQLRDGLWKWLQEPFSKSYESCHLPTLVQDMVGTTFEFEAMDATIGPVRFETGVTKGRVLKTLNDEFGLISYLRDGKLFVGVLFDTAAPTVTYDVERNVRGSDLKYRVSEDERLKVKARSIKNDGDDLEVELGDEDGAQRTLTYYGIETEEALRKLAEADMQRFRYDGWEGTLTGFGLPVCQFGDKVHIRSSQYPDRDSESVVEAVGVRFDPNGFRREVKPAQQWT